MNIFKKIATVAFGTLFSRVFGFAREIFMASALGTGPVADAFNAAFRFPNTFRRLFAEGAFNAAFIPLFSKKIEEKKIEEAHLFSKEVLSFLFAILLLLTIIMELSMPFLVRHVIAPGFKNNATKFELTIRFATIMFPYLSCMSLAAMMSGILNSLRRYFAAAIAPVFLNLILISVLFFAWYKNLNPWHIGLYLSWGVLVSGILQLAVLIFAARHIGISISLSFPRLTKNVKKLLWLAFPAAITGGITQINLLINTNIASKEAGAISALAYADRLYQLPLGVIGIAVATVLLPELSRALRNKNYKESFLLQNRSIEAALFLTIPAAVGFCAISYPIVHLIYQHGHFTEESTRLVSQILIIYGLGLPAFVLIKTLVPLFMARENTKTPMFFALLSVIVNCTLAITLFPIYSAKGIAIAEITAGWVNVFLLFFTLVKRKDWIYESILVKRILKLILSALLMGICVFFFYKFFSNFFSSQPLFVEIFILLTTLVFAFLSYLFFTFLTGVIPTSIIKRLVKR